jgi:hypothetical protein
MTEAPDVYPEFPDDDAVESDDQGVEGRVLGEAEAEQGGWRAHADGARLTVDGDGTPGDWWRVVAAAAWARLDDGGEPPDTAGLEPPEA